MRLSCPLLCACIVAATLPLSVQGTEGDVRLVGSSGLTRGMAGRVEVFTSGSWITVTESSSVGRPEADVICRQLGFPNSVYCGTVGELGFTPSLSQVSQALSTFSCSGTETKWRSCVYSVSTLNVDHARDFAVSCGGTYSSSDAQSFPTNGDLRLNTGGSSRPYSGRLEVYYHKQWGTVCDDLFSKADADVACRQLGLIEALYYGSDIGFGSGSGPIWLDDVRCGSNHTGRLVDCPHSLFASYTCSHTQDIALVCVGEGSLRLTSGRSGSTSASLSSGRLEVYAGGRWGTVCDDGFGQTEADTACRGLGYARAVDYNSASLSRSFDTSLPILLDDVRCSASSNFLLLCSHRGIGKSSCGHTEDTAIKCSTQSLSASLAIRVLVPLVTILVLTAIIIMMCYYHLTIKKKKARATRTSPHMVDSISSADSLSQPAAGATQLSWDYPTCPPAYSADPPTNADNRKRDTELCTDAPPAYTEVENYPPYTSGEDHTQTDHAEHSPLITETN